MNIHIEEQIPLSMVKLSGSSQIFIPAVVKKKLHWKFGDNLEVYGLRQGIFITKTKEVD